MWTSSENAVPPLWWFARTLQLLSFCWSFSLMFVFSKWNIALSDYGGIDEYSTYLPVKPPVIVLHYVFGHCLSSVWNSNQHYSIWMILSMHDVYCFTPELISLLLPSDISKVNNNDRVPLEGSHDHAITLSPSVLQWMLFSSVRERFHAFTSFFPPIFWYSFTSFIQRIALTFSESLI